MPVRSRGGCATPPRERFWRSWRRRSRTEESARIGWLLKRFLTLVEVAHYAAFAASVWAGARTGAIATIRTHHIARVERRSVLGSAALPRPPSCYSTAR